MINYVVGDATNPVKHPAMIVHICNNLGRWGAGFVLAVSKKWGRPEQEYLEKERYILGTVDFVSVTENITVANMIAQNGVRHAVHNPKPLDLGALRTALATVSFVAGRNGLSVHMPRIGCGLAGGTWDEVSAVIDETLADIDVYVYDLP